MSTRAGVLLAIAALTAGCAAPAAPVFRVDNARAHVERLAGTIGPRPIGTKANAAARAYLVDQLRLYGFDVRLQEVDATRTDLGVTARVSNIVAIKPGERPDAIALVAHYDSVPDGPGAMDDGLGTAVSLEAARVLAARATARYTLVVALTDGEEAGLMGAAGLVEDAELRSRVRAFLNLESIGASGPSLLFESGPGNEALVRAWSRAVPRPRGASYAVEIYKRLPNDTDFTILRQWGVPGLNFASVADSHAYHTSRDTPDRLSSATLQHMGETVVALTAALDRTDLSAKAGRDVRFSDVLGRRGVVLAPWQGRLVAILAVLAGMAAWWRMTRALFGVGLVRAVSTLVWGALSVGAALGLMVGAVWLLRATREVYHPWYASSGRLLALLIVCGIVGPWYVTRVAALLPERWRYVRTPEAIWTLVLLPWCALVAFLEWAAPAAAHVFAIPVLLCSLLLAAPASPGARRLASGVALLICAAFFVPDGLLLFQLLVAVFGRLPLVTPFWIYPAFLALVGLMVAPPAAALLVGLVRGRAQALTGAFLLLALAVTVGLAAAADAYTPRDPLRRYAQYVSDQVANVTVWDVASNEPGLDLDLPTVEAARWRPVPPGTASPVSLPGILPRQGAFVFRRIADATPAPATVSARTTTLQTEGGAVPAVEYELAVLPSEEALTARVVLPPGLTPIRASPAGIAAGGRWQSAYVAIPPAGVSFRLTIAAIDAPRLTQAVVVIGAWRSPGPAGERPRWLPTARAAWSERAAWIVAPAPALDVPAAPPPSLPATVALR